jgi:hypothetical protein
MAIMNVALNMRMQASLWPTDFNAIEYITGTGIARLHANSILDVLRKLHVVFQNDY